jgi:hypothetical protein
LAFKIAGGQYIKGGTQKPLDNELLSRQCEKFLFGQSRKFLLTAFSLEGWSGSR